MRLSSGGSSYDLYYGKHNSVQQIGDIRVVDKTTPSLVITLGVMINSFKNGLQTPRVKVRGFRNGNKIFFTSLETTSTVQPAPTPTVSSNPGVPVSGQGTGRWELSLFNVNDKINVYLNGKSTPDFCVTNGVSLEYDANANSSCHSSSTQQISRFHDYLQNGTNIIRFQVVNDNDRTTRGFAMGIELKNPNGQIVYRDIQGNTTPQIYTSIFGANGNTEGLGPRYDNFIYINKDMSVPGLPPYVAEVSNTSDINRIKVNISSVPIALSATSLYSAEATLDPFLNFNSINDVGFEVVGATSSVSYPTDAQIQNLPSDQKACAIYNSNPYINRKSFTYGFAMKSSLGPIYYNKDGQRENLRLLCNTRGETIGFGAQFNKPLNPGDIGLNDLWKAYFGE